MMEIQRIAKYQNISDRIKRLASASNLSTLPFQTQNPIPVRLNQSPKKQTHQKNQQQKSLRANFVVKETHSRTATQETDRNHEDQSHSFIHQLMSLRENQANKMLNHEKKATDREQVEEKQWSDKMKKDKRELFGRKHRPIEEHSQKKLNIERVKSQKNLKIDEIIQSFDSYKVKKQNILVEIQKNVKIGHQRNVSENLNNYFQDIDQQENDKCRQTNRNEHLFTQINNLRKQQSKAEDLSLKYRQERREVKEINYQFRRGHRNRQSQMAQLPQIVAKEIKMTSEEEIRPIQKCKSKLILKNLNFSKENEQKDPTIALNMVLSPRLRIPGKICKNSDKSTIDHSKW